MSICNAAIYTNLLIDIILFSRIVVIRNYSKQFDKIPVWCRATMYGDANKRLKDVTK